MPPKPHLSARALSYRPLLVRSDAPWVTRPRAFRSPLLLTIRTPSRSVHLRSTKRTNAQVEAALTSPGRKTADRHNSNLGTRKTTTRPPQVEAPRTSSGRPLAVPVFRSQGMTQPPCVTYDVSRRIVKGFFYQEIIAHAARRKAGRASSMDSKANAAHRTHPRHPHEVNYLPKDLLRAPEIVLHVERVTPRTTGIPSSSVHLSPLQPRVERRTPR